MDYKSDNFWREVQLFLPFANRLQEDTMPQEYFLNIQDVKVHIDHYQPKNPKARIILLHGVGGNGRLLSFLAIPLMRNGFEVVCPDLPLYGCTQYKGSVTYDSWVDIGTVLVKELGHNGLPLFLFGLSAGGMLAYQIANRCPEIKGLLATCLLDQRNPYITRKTGSNIIIIKVGMPLLSVTHKFIGFLKVPMKLVANMKKIANNKTLAQLLMRDKKSSGAWVPLAFLHTMLNPVIHIEPENFTMCPFLLVHPGDDRWTKLDLSKLFFDRLACKKVLKILENAGHFPIEPKGLQQLEEYSIAFINECLIDL